MFLSKTHHSSAAKAYFVVLGVLNVKKKKKKTHKDQLKRPMTGCFSNHLFASKVPVVPACHKLRMNDVFFTAETCDSCWLTVKGKDVSTVPHLLSVPQTGAL